MSNVLPDWSRRRVIILGIVFLCYGILWLSVFTQRYDLSAQFRYQKLSPHSVEQVISPVQSVSPVQNISIVLQEAKVELRRKSHITPRERMIFWVVGWLEAVAALLYVIAGMAFLRGYRNLKRYAYTAIFFDCFFKAAVFYSYYCIAFPLQLKYHAKNALLMYYLPRADGWSMLSGYFTGIQLTQQNSLAYHILTVIFYLCVLWTLARK